MKFHNQRFFDRKTHGRRALWLTSVILLGQAVYLLLSHARYRVGFPLDDAWIHQTYARNFVETFRWEFIAGQLSGGSPSQLWTVLLMPGFFLGGKFYLVWTFFLGFSLLFLTAWVFEDIVRIYIKPDTKIPLFGLLLVLEWHVFWATNSGMETILLIFILVTAAKLILQGRTKQIGLAILMSLLLWVRPDAISFYGVFFFAFLAEMAARKASFKQLIRPLILLTASIMLYGGFNLLVAGSFFPNTFYAKQAEYAILYDSPLLQRYLAMLGVPLTGVGAVLLPGFLFKLYELVKQKDYPLIGLAMWFFSYLLLFAIRLPVTYQHGRYIIPAIPFALLLGILGSHSILNVDLRRFGWVVKQALKISAILVLLIFWGMGANAFSTDVAIIESEMVDTAQWIDENTADKALIAAHDIGALGFFSERRIVDLAGLISPEVIPFIRDENRLRAHLDQQDVEYLMTFPGWYPHLISAKELVYQGNAAFSPLAGGENMAVYKWNE